MWKNPYYWKFGVSRICGPLFLGKKKKKGRLKITWKQNTERRKSKWDWKNNHDLTWVFFVTTNSYCHLRRKCVLVREPVHTSVLKIRNVFHLHKFHALLTCPWRPVIEDTILEYSIPRSQPVEDSVFKNIRKYQKTHHRLLNGWWYHYRWHCFQVNISENGKTFQGVHQSQRAQVSTVGKM